MSIFAPLNIVTGYSFLQSGLTVKNAVSYIKQSGYAGGGIADIDTMYGVPEFAQLMKEQNLPFALGMKIHIKQFDLSLFAKTEVGYRNLVYLCTLVSKEELSFEALKEHSSDLTAIIETRNEAFKEWILGDQNDNSFKKALYELSSPYGDYFFLGLDIQSKEDMEYAKKVRTFANNYTYKTIAFPKIRYAKKNDAIVLEIVTAIEKEEKITTKSASGNEYFMKESDYAKIYLPSELEETVHVVSSSNFEFNVKRGEMLHYQCDDSTTLLKEKCFASLKEKDLENEEHINRLNHELDIIISMGYADYFLLVQDYVSYARNAEILVGPGRGSAAGSLVSYLLGITEVDPLTYNLQFERFLNPFRKTMPDIDVDFMDTRRDEVIDYLRSKYGKDKVASIVTFQTIKAKQSLRDIGRVYSIPDQHINLLCKRITEDKVSLRMAYKTIPSFRELVDSDPYFLEIVSLASKIENLPRQSGQHAAGIVLNNDALELAVPISFDLNGNAISQYKMEYLESQGFLKMDFLALRNLTTVQRAVEIINQAHPDVHLKGDALPFDEKEVYSLISSGYTMGVFQLESAGMKRAIRVLKPSCFEDVVALLALYRPGPMDSIASYARRKEGKEKVNYASKELEEILSPTYGIIVYQEQINQIAVSMAGFSLGEADLFRRAISKKDVAKLNAQEKSFIDGAMKKGYTEAMAKSVFHQILPFAEYGFNRSHSVVYSMLACREAWLKYHYPLEFYAAILETSSGANDAKFSDYMSEMRARNISISKPSINESGKEFVIINNNLAFPLSAIRGVDEIMVTNILKERENGLFTDFFDFVSRMYPYKMSESVLLHLIDSGSLDCLYPSRASMRVSLRNALQYAELSVDESGQMNIGIAAYMKPSIHEEQDNPLDNLDKEYETIGVMLSDNPLRYKKDILSKNSVQSINEAMNNLGNHIIAGIIKSKKTITTKKGSQMAFMTIFDETGEMEVTVFPETYSKSVSLLEKQNIIIIEGRSEEREESISFLASTIRALEE